MTVLETSPAHRKDPNNSTPIHIVGAGIAGLSTGLFLARSGFAVRVYETAGELSEVGAGIQLGPNASKILLAAGFKQALDATAFTTSRNEVRSLSTGRLIACLDTSQWATRFGSPNLSLHRADLQLMLLQACQAQAGFSLQLRSTIEQLGNLPGLWIYANGLWSPQRDLILRSLGQPVDQATYTGKVAIRIRMPIEAVQQAIDQAPTATPKLPNHRLDPMQLHLWLGQDAHVVHYPIRCGTEMNLIAMRRLPDSQAQLAQRDWAATENTQQNIQALVRDGFSQANPTLAAILKAGALHSPRFWPLYDRPAMTQFHSGQHLLIGDAAHPTQAHLAQGAAMAIEDAAVLAGCFEQCGATPDAFALFSQLRWARVAKVQAKARQYGNIYQAGPPLSWGRNLFLNSPLPQATAAGLSWLYEGVPTEQWPSWLRNAVHS